MDKIIAVVVTYNRCDLLLECVCALKESIHPVDVLIVDNASTDDTKQRIRPFVDEKKIFYLNTGENLGGAGGFNFGLKKVYEMGYEFFWLMDDDTIVKPDSLTKLLEAKNIIGNEFGFLSSLAIWKDGSICHMNHHHVAPNWNDKKNLLEKGMLQIEIATFVSFFMKRNIVEHLGFPIKEYFIWGDDTEYSLRISSQYPCYLVFNSKVVHKMKENQSAASFAEFCDVNRINRMFYSFRNGCNTQRCRGVKKLIRYIFSGLCMLVKVLQTKKTYKFKKICVLLKGYFVGLVLFHPKKEFPTGA